MVKRHNTQLKFDLLKSMQFSRLKELKSNKVLRVNLQQANGKVRPICIPVLRDRTIQMFMHLILEPYMEPCGDKNSWGYRPGRGTNYHSTSKYS